MTTSKIGIVLLNWNGKDDTLECLTSLSQISYSNYQVVVVDNGSSDDSVHAIKESFPDVTLIETGANLGFAEGNNVGVRHALEQNCDYVLLLNNDTVVEPNLLDVLVEYAISKGGLGVFGPKITYYDKPDVIWWAGSKWDNAKQRFDHVGLNEEDSPAFDQPGETDYICGCALFIPTRIIDDIGLMDAKFFLTYEETDWCYRARKAGYPSYYVPGARVFHKISVSFGGANSPLQQYFYTRNKLLWAARHLTIPAFLRLFKKTVLGVACWDRTTRFSLRSIRWQIRNALAKLSTGNKDPLQAAKAQGLRDFLFRRFGDCPQHVRTLGKSPTIAGSEVHNTCIGFIPWWPQNPYQVLLRDQLRIRGFRIIGNPPLSLLRTLLKRDGLDVVHLHWPHALYHKNYWRYGYALLILSLYRIRKNNIVWTVHELDFYETRYPLLDLLFVKFLMKISRALIVHSDYSEAEIRRRFDYRRHTLQVKHPSYIDVYANDIGREEARERLAIAADVKVFLFLGYLKPYKGVEDLIEAFGQLEDKSSLLVIGGNPLNDEIANTLRALCEGNDRIKLHLGYIPDDDMQVYLNAADLVVFPFRQTHTSGSILLAASFCKAVLVPHTASIPEYIDDSFGYFFDPDKKDSLKMALERATKGDLVNMGLQAYRAVSAHTWEEMADIHTQIYNLVAGSKN
tara:strand:- start:1825 stop:3870 length:2046 start_codon:yes stop_codon:yes gene_type:complete